jgi:hypothetical protein
VYDRVVIDSGQLVNGLWMGTVLILVSLAPGIVKRCLDALRFPGFPLTALKVRAHPFLHRTPFTFEPPRRLAWVGVAIMLTAVLAYIS